LVNIVCADPALDLLGVVLELCPGVYTFRCLEFKTSAMISSGATAITGVSTVNTPRNSTLKRITSSSSTSNQPERNKAAIDALVQGLLSPRNNPHSADDPGAQQFVADDLFYQVNLQAFSTLVSLLPPR